MSTGLGTLTEDPLPEIWRYGCFWGIDILNTRNELRPGGIGLRDRGTQGSGDAQGSADRGTGSGSGDGLSQPTEMKTNTI